MHKIRARHSKERRVALRHVSGVLGTPRQSNIRRKKKRKGRKTRTKGSTKPRSINVLLSTKERRPALQRVSDLPETARGIHIHPRKKKKTKKAAHKTRRPPHPHRLPLIHEPQTPADGSQTPQRATGTSKTPRRTIKAKRDATKSRKKT
jgi:hypothetical protein